MGTQEGDTDWVDVANNLLNKCHINRRIGNLADCDAGTFVALYENILGEKVPDYIAVPSSQEDDVHNVQSVIDSLSLDYLQISLSHITGENVVRGDGDSVKNLLEIFDGLLEYLKEEIREEAHGGGEPGHSLSQELTAQTEEAQNGDAPVLEEADPDPPSPSPSPSPSSESAAQSKRSEEEGSTSQLIGLGASARTLSTQQDGAPQTDPLTSAIALQPPSQSDPPHRTEAEPRPPTAAQEGEEAPAVPEQAGAPGGGLVPDGPAADGEETRSVIPETDAEVEALQPTNGGPRRVLFRTQPDVLFLTLQDVPAGTPSPLDTEDEDLSLTGAGLDKKGGPRERSGLSSRAEQEDEDLLSSRRQRNKRAEEELHHLSENLSHRLEELDQMLKRVLNESGESPEVREDGEGSLHSDRVMEGHGPCTGSPEPVSTPQTCSPSPPPPRLCGPSHRQAEALSPCEGRQTNLRVSDSTRRKESQHRPSHRRHSKIYEEELSRYEDRGRADLDQARLRAREAERQYREAILSDVPQASRPSPDRTATQHRPQRNTQTSAGKGRHEAPRRAPMKVKENDLLPVLLEELPYLHITPHTLGRMWTQQMQQVDRLHAMSAPGPRHSRLSSQVEEAQRKHDLLVEIVRKDQEHRKRLRDFKERIQQQKSTQNRLKEQRQQVARARKYHNDYHVQHRARLMRARTREEKMFRHLFEEGLELQKARLREQRAYAREQRLEHQRRHQDHIISLENYYKDQFSLLAEKLAQERQDIQVRKKAQEKALLKMKRELRSRMEREIGELQKIIIENDQDDHFQDLEVQRLRNRVHLASFQYNTSYLH